MAAAFAARANVLQLGSFRHSLFCRGISTEFLAVQGRTMSWLPDVLTLGDLSGLVPYHRVCRYRTR